MSKREEYQTQIAERLDLWDARLAALTTKAGKEASQEQRTRFDHWATASQVLRGQLAKLKATSGDSWDPLKEEIDKGWQEMERVLDQGNTAFPTITSDEIKAMTSDQKDAILEALVVAVVANARVGQDEKHRLKEEVIRIPWDEPKEAIIEKAKAAEAKVSAMKGDEEHVVLLKSIAARLPSKAVAEKLIAMMGRVMGAADRSVDAKEQNTLIAYALAFGIDAERFKAIADSIRGA